MIRTSAPLACLASALLLAACGGTQNNATAPQVSQAVEVPVAPFLTQIPRGDENPDELFFLADSAFQQGIFGSANRDFGTLFVIAPGIRGGAPEQALALTCQRIGIDCDLQFARLRFLRDAVYGVWGNRATWHPQQEADFRGILACYDHAIVGDFAQAGSRGQPALASPLDGFRAAAGVCMERVDAAMADVRRREIADQAWGAWQGAWPCVDENHRALLAAADAQDWEAFVTQLPAWESCAPTVQRIVDDGVLEGDPRVGIDHDMAWSALGEIEILLEDYADVITSTRRGLVALDGDPDYDRLQVQLNEVRFAEDRLLGEVQSLEQAQSMLGENDARTLQPQVDALNNELMQLRNQRRQIMGAINAIRSIHGLPPRD